jgi:hypothetical protein
MGIDRNSPSYHAGWKEALKNALFQLDQWDFFSGISNAHAKAVLKVLSLDEPLISEDGKTVLVDE